MSANDGTVEVDEVTPGGLDTMSERRERFAALTARKRAIEAEKREVQKELDALEALVLDDYAELGTDSMRTVIGEQRYTVHLATEVFAGPLKSGVKDKGDEASTDEDWARACAALRAVGLGHLVGEKFHPGSLGSWVNELRDEHGPDWRDHVPDTVLDALRIGDRQRVRVRKA